MEIRYLEGTLQWSWSTWPKWAWFRTRANLKLPGGLCSVRTFKTIYGTFIRDINDWNNLSSLIHTGSFLSQPFLTFFSKKNKFCFISMKIHQRFLDKMLQNFDDYPDFQPKITHPKHFSHQCTSILGGGCMDFSQTFQPPTSTPDSRVDTNVCGFNSLDRIRH